MSDGTVSPPEFSLPRLEEYEPLIGAEAVSRILIVHDPQPLPMVRFFRKKAPWIWRCHVDLSRPDEALWKYLSGFIEHYDAVVLSLPEYAQKLTPPQRFIMPAINPFSSTNRPLSEEEIDERLSHYGVPTDLPLIVQVSRFDTRTRR